MRQAVALGRGRTAGPYGSGFANRNEEEALLDLVRQRDAELPDSTPASKSAVTAPSFEAAHESLPNR